MKCRYCLLEWPDCGEEMIVNVGDRPEGYNLLPTKKDPDGYCKAVMVDKSFARVGVDLEAK